MAREQKSLFHDPPPAWETDDQQLARVATVVFAQGPGQAFDYRVPDALADQIAVGKRVRVPLGQRARPIEGYCVRLETRSTTRTLRPVSAVIDRRCLLSPAMLRLTEWIAEHYLCGWGQVIEAVVPAGVRGQAGTRETVVLSLSPAGTAQLAQPGGLNENQLRVLRYLAACAEPVTAKQLALALRVTTSPIQTLRKRGLISAHRVRVRTQPSSAAVVPAEADLQLNSDQHQALGAIVAALRGGIHQTLLLYGVTGSGKTEVYIRAIQEATSFGRQAIVLVPEISLTPQTVARFRTRFPRVAVLHSHMSDSERSAHWEAIAAGQVQVVVGARSAIFAPTPHLGLVVLDEEHEATFKQESPPRYHARDVALERARAENVPLVLGSATPSLESWHRAQTGVYHLLRLPRRVEGRPLPRVQIIDLRIESQDRRARGALSRPLLLAMRQSLEAQGQVILLLNRRGYSTHIQCPACGLVVRCPNCEVALTHHRLGEIALCHYCDFQQPAPANCPECRFAGIRYGGLGTQRLEAEVKARFPDRRLLRMDTDTMQAPGSHERALDAFRSGQVHILLGTQMIAKGLDFPNVTLVGVVNADTALHLPDFRASERTFQLLAQVAGRTGRGDKGGRVVVQTLSPEHPAVLAAARHDYERFSAEELPLRQWMWYPPYGHLVRLVVRGQVLEVARAMAEHLGRRVAEEVNRLGPPHRVLGPAPAPIARLRDQYRFQVQIQGPDGPGLRAAVRTATGDLAPPEGVQWIADVDPSSML